MNPNQFMCRPVLEYGETYISPKNLPRTVHKGRKKTCYCNIMGSLLEFLDMDVYAAKVTHYPHKSVLSAVGSITKQIRIFSLPIQARTINGELYLINMLKTPTTIIKEDIDNDHF